ncbi:MAG: PEP-CTERM sorting domain-containing protein [Aquabacterium sp.]
MTLAAPAGDVSVNVPAAWANGTVGTDITYQVVSATGGPEGARPAISDVLFYWPNAQVTDKSLIISFYNPDQLNSGPQVPLRAQNTLLGSAPTLVSRSNGLKIDVPLAFGEGAADSAYEVSLQLSFNGQTSPQLLNGTSWFDTQVNLRGNDSQGGSFTLASVEKRYTGVAQESYVVTGVIAPGQDIRGFSADIFLKWNTDAVLPASRYVPQFESQLFVDSISITPLSAVPEPGTLPLLGIGLAALLLAQRRRV